MAQSQYEHLFSPFNIGKVQLKNRIVKTAAQTYLFESERTASVRLPRPSTERWREAASA